MLHGVVTQEAYKLNGKINFASEFCEQTRYTQVKEVIYKRSSME